MEKQEEKENEETSTSSSSTSLLLIEPFYCGSHKQLIDLLISSHDDPSRVELVTLTGKKWPWRARTSALWLSTAIPEVGADVKTLFASSVLNLAELVALRPDVRNIPNKILYFHENQLSFPVRKAENRERDFQFGYNQIMSCLVADVVVFNSQYNMNTFLDSINSFLNLMPDYRPKGLKDKISPKCRVIHYPIDFKGPQLQPTDRRLREEREVINASYTDRRLREEEREEGEMIATSSATDEPLHIVWPHRWEHDKDPETFFAAMFKLREEGFQFRLSVLGERFSKVPEVFEEAHQRLHGEIVQWGYLPTKESYFDLLRKADVVVSTARHEFFGVAMLEAIHCGCYPVAPKDLVYPELYPPKHLFNTPNQLYKMLKQFCKNPNSVRRSKIDVDTSLFSWNVLRHRYRTLLS